MGTWEGGCVGGDMGGQDMWVGIWEGGCVGGDMDRQDIGGWGLLKAKHVCCSADLHTVKILE